MFATIKVGGKDITKKAEALKTDSLNLHIIPQLSLLQEDEKKLNDETITRDIETQLSSRHFRKEILFYKEHSFDLFRETAQRTWPGLRIQRIEYDYAENHVKLYIYDSQT